MRLRLRGVRPGALAIPDAVIAAHELLAWGGFVLPLVGLPGGAVLPVVAWTRAATTRLEQGIPPNLCRYELAAWEAGGPGSAVEILGFLHHGAPAPGVARLKSVSGYGPGALVVTDARRVSAWTLAEADMAGLSVVEYGGRTVSASWVIHGNQAHAGPRRRTVSRRLREEQLFQWAIDSGFDPMTTGSCCLDLVHRLDPGIDAALRLPRGA
jgi:hypothetical protein